MVSIGNRARSTAVPANAPAKREVAKVGCAVCGLVAMLELR
jgi:hypothetical protein